MTVDGGITDQVKEEVKDILTTLTGGSNDVDYHKIKGSDTIIATTKSEGKVVNIVVASNDAVKSATVDNGVFETIVDTPAKTSIVNVAADSLLQANKAMEFISAELKGVGKDTTQTAIASSLNSFGKLMDHSNHVQVTKIKPSSDEENATQDVITLDLSKVENVIQVLDLSASTGISDTKVIINHAKAVLAIGSATIEIIGKQGTIVAGDDANQLIIGGLGADTLMGGGGNDSIVGGQDDTFGFNSTDGKISIDGLSVFSDFTKANSTFDFSKDIFGVSTVGELNSNINSVLGMETWGTADEYTTYVFQSGLEITLTGVTADEVTAEMVAFTI